VKRLAANAKSGLPDLFSIVFDPAILGIDLREFALGAGSRRPVPIEQDGASAAGPLVDGENIGWCRHLGIRSG